MVDTSGSAAAQDRMQRVAQSATFTVLARGAMILWAGIGGPVAVWALISGIGLAVDLRDSMRDLRRDVGFQAKAIEQLQLQDLRTSSQLEGVTTRIQSLEFQNRGR